MAKYGCYELYLDKHYIANNNLDWKPGETTSFVAYVDNINSNAECDVTVFWEFNGETVESETRNGISGNTRFIETRDHDYILNSVGPGVYNMKTVIFHDGSDQVEEWWTDDNGDKVEIVVYDENGNHPGASSNILVESIDFDDTDYVTGQRATATVTFENTGDLEGTETFDIEVDPGDEGYYVEDTVSVTLGPSDTTSTSVSFTVGKGATANVRVGNDVNIVNIIEDPIYNESLNVSTYEGRIEARYSFDNYAHVNVTFDVNVKVNTPSGAGAETVYDSNHTLTATEAGGSTTFDIPVDVQPGYAKEYTVCVRRI